MSNNNCDKIKEDIIKTLKEHPEGLTAVDISKILCLHRHTVTKYILVLEAIEIVCRRKVGSATLHYLKENYSGKELKVNK